MSLQRILLSSVLFAALSTGQVSERAKKLHRDALVFDGHVHVIDRQFYIGGDIGQRVNDGQVDLPRAKEGGVGAMFFSLFVMEEYYPSRLETKQALRLVDLALTQLAKNRDLIELALNAIEHGALANHSGIVKVSLYPRAAATNASAIPVFPLVGSTSSTPGFSTPRSSASQIIEAPIRHFTE